MPAEVAAAIECTAEPPHRFAIAERSRVGNGILVTLKRLDEPYPPRNVFVTNREMKMGYENVRSLAGGFRAWKDAGLPSATD